jgi:hypothetical protein
VSVFCLSGAAAASLRGPYPSALSLAAAQSRFSPYGKPPSASPFPPSPLPPSLGGLGGGLPPGLGGLPPYLSSLGAANPLSFYSLYGGRL